MHFYTPAAATRIDEEAEPPVSPLTATDFHPGAATYSADGVHVGTLHRLIVDRESWDLQHIVVQETRRFSGHLFTPGTALITDDVVIPLDAVAKVTHDRVDLTMDAPALRRLPPYLSYHIAPWTARDSAMRSLSVLSGAPFVRPLVESADKTEAQLEIRSGEKIMLGHTGHRLGRVHDVLYDGRELVGVVMHPDGFFTEDVILQVRFLDRSDDLVLFAHLTEADMERLQPFQPT